MEQNTMFSSPIGEKRLKIGLPREETEMLWRFSSPVGEKRLKIGTITF